VVVGLLAADAGASDAIAAITGPGATEGLLDATQPRNRRLRIPLYNGLIRGYIYLTSNPHYISFISFLFLCTTLSLNTRHRKVSLVLVRMLATLPRDDSVKTFISCRFITFGGSGWNPFRWLYYLVFGA
jgi:hypothetical protein